MTSPGVYAILSGNNVLYNTRTLVCATNDTSQQIQWMFKPIQNDTESDITAQADWNSITGISTLGSTQQGYYSCDITIGIENIVYTAAIFDPTLTVGKSRFI